MQGSTEVTLHGGNFLLQNSPTVNFNGVLCDVKSYSQNTVTCVTRERDPNCINPHSLSLRTDFGLATVADNARFKYIDKWSDLTSWKNQEPPMEGDLVWIPSGQVILLDESTPILTMIIIEGELHFDQTKDLNVDASYIYVFGGLLQVGTHEVIRILCYRVKLMFMLMFIGTL